MRKDIHEAGQGFLMGAPSIGHGPVQPVSTKGRKMRADALNATAVDAALDGEDAAPIVSERGSRRELPGTVADAERRKIDVPHIAGAKTGEASDGALLRRLSQQLCALQSQQDQIRLLLEQAEGRRAGRA